MKLNSAFQRTDPVHQDDILPVDASGKLADFKMHLDTADVDCKMVEMIQTPASDVPLIEHVIDCLSFGLESISEDVLLRLQHARTTAVTRRRL